MSAITASSSQQHRTTWHRLAVLGLLLSAWFPAFAGTIDISNEPLINKTQVAAKPNIMFILDDSGSMARAYMPDDMDDTSTYGYYSPQCNGVAFDPDNNDYAPPVGADGVSYLHSSYTGAWSDGYQPSGSSSRTSTSTVTLGTGTKTMVVTWTSSSSGPGYTVGQVLYVKSRNDSTKTFKATVASYGESGRTATFTLTVATGDFTGTGSDASWTIYTLVNLSGSFYYEYNKTAANPQPKMGWRYSASGGVIGDSSGESAMDGYTFYNECMTAQSTSTTKFTKVLLDSASADVKRKYADWYSYYRTRQLMMRWGVGGAFSKLDTSYRVGFATISDTSVSETDASGNVNNRFLNVRDFGGTQKTTFFSKLYSATATSSTPLRGALSKAGRYFANKATGQTVDPMQYSCQRNYAILSTDGYWNTPLESSTAGSKYGPYGLDNDTAVGQQDGVSEVRPFRDSQKTAVTVVTSYSTSETRVATNSGRTTTTPLSRYQYSIPTSPTGCSGSQKRMLRQTQVATRTLVQSIISNQTRSGTYTGTQVTTDGVAAAETFTTTSWGGWTTTSSNTVNTSDTTSSYTNSGTATVVTACTTATLTLPSPNPSTPTSGTSTGPSAGTTAYSTSTAGPVVAGTSTSTTSYPGGSTSSLADVAEYFYKTDLRTAALDNCISGTTGEDVCSNETLVPKALTDFVTIYPAKSDGSYDVTATAEKDKNEVKTQHMSTFTIGLGVPGTLVFNSDYMTNASSVFQQIKAGTQDWPNPTADTATAIDDLWHAAVNGRGQYFSALNAQQLASSLKETLAGVTAKPSAGAGVAASSFKLAPGDNNFIYAVTYETVSWIGNLSAYRLNADTASITIEPVWTAQAQLNATAYTDRKIYYYRPGSGDKLAAFTYANLTTDGLNTNFSGFCSTSRTIAPSQCDAMTSANKTLADNGTNLVNWLRGDRSYEMTATTKLFRTRKAVLGDIISGEPVNVGKPFLGYADPGYAAFTTAQASVQPIVLTTANDGMLHAFYSTGSNAGKEAWAYVPRMVMPNLYRLADTDYGSNHVFTADGPPVAADVYTGSAWKTVVVAGLNGGGKGFYALDVTDPNNPKALWEVSSSTSGFENLGLTYSRPVITKVSNGRWVVAVSSGYNNADGVGYVYIIDVMDGTLLTKISTGVGSAGSPSGLGSLNPWIDVSTDNTAKRFYGGDMLGNLWRFEVTAPSDRASNSFSGTAVKLANFSVTSGGVSTPQPITTQPLPVRVQSGGTTYPVVLVGTGRYLGLTDLNDHSQQSLYAVKDPLTTTGWGSFRDRTDIVVQTLTTVAGTDSNGDGDYIDAGEVAPKRMGVKNQLSWNDKAGWMMDLPSSGERVGVNMTVQYNYLAVPTIVPSGNACVSAGSSWYYTLDINTGSPTSSDGVAGYLYSATNIVVGISYYLTADGKIIPISVDSGGGAPKVGPPTPPADTDYKAKRASWRELLN